jgi:hypothetical protein
MDVTDDVSYNLFISLLAVTPNESESNVVQRLYFISDLTFGLSILYLQFMWDHTYHNPDSIMEKSGPKSTIT